MDYGSSFFKLRAVQLPLFFLNRLKPPHEGFGNFFLTSTYQGIGTMCIESETCYEKYHDKRTDGPSAEK